MTNGIFSGLTVACMHIWDGQKENIPPPSKTFKAFAARCDEVWANRGDAIVSAYSTVCHACKLVRIGFVCRENRLQSFRNHQPICSTDIASKLVARHSSIIFSKGHAELVYYTRKHTAAVPYNATSAS